MCNPSNIPSYRASRFLFDLLQFLPVKGSLIIIVKFVIFKTLQSLPFCNQMTQQNYVRGQNVWLAMTSTMMCHITRYIIFIRKSQGPKYKELRGPLWVFVSTIPKVCWPMTFSFKVASGAHTFGTPCICRTIFVKRGSQIVSSGTGTSPYFEVTNNTVMGNWTANKTIWRLPKTCRASILHGSRTWPDIKSLSPATGNKINLDTGENLPTR